jgi:hypothetical protein
MNRDIGGETPWHDPELERLGLVDGCKIPALGIVVGRDGAQAGDAGAGEA